MALLLGIDTGGTFTDAVALTPDGVVVATAKAPTTHHDLAIGVAGALRAVLDRPEVSAAEVGLVALSTTLATNALVEGQGGAAGLVAVGFGPAEIERMVAGGFDGPVVAVDGGHDALGNEQAPLALEVIDRSVGSPSVSAFAVVAQFSVRNPAHELAVRDRLRAVADRPVTCSHELSARLDGPRRARTALLNARLIGVIGRLQRSVERALAAAGVEAPVMVVKGDGSLAAAGFVAARPIETILSGPAASLVGARHLADIGRDGTALVADIGGTTTDIAALVDGRPRIGADGAEVAGHRTMVTAVELLTHGLGGDSEVRAGDATHRLLLGPDRAVPVCRLAVADPGVLDLLDRQLADPNPAEAHGRLVVAVAAGTHGIGAEADGLDEIERQILEAVAGGPRTQLDVAKTSRRRLALQRLRSRGLVRMATFTPTDASLLLGHLTGADHSMDGARVAAALLARTQRTTGAPVAESVEELALAVHELVVARTTDALLDAALQADGLAPAASETSSPPGGAGVPGGPLGGVVASELVRAALAARQGDGRAALAARGGDGAGHRALSAVTIGLGVSVIAVGASAATYYPAAGDRLGTEVIVPPHAEVANAVGAAVGRIRIERTLTVSRPRAGQFVVHVDDQPRFVDLEAARLHARKLLDAQVRSLAADAGAHRVEVAHDWSARTAMVNGRELLIEGTATAVAEGPPLA
ncbi:MAG: hydantoinase/oxoprolinase family protein [Actinomycetota bacterium]